MVQNSDNRVQALWRPSIDHAGDADLEVNRVCVHLLRLVEPLINHLPETSLVLSKVPFKPTGKCYQQRYCYCNCLGKG